MRFPRFGGWRIKVKPRGTSSLRIQPLNIPSNFREWANTQPWQINAAGGVGPYTFAVVNGTPIPGYALQTNGQYPQQFLSRPTAGNYTWTVEARDSAGAAVQAVISVTVAYATLSVSSDAPPAAVVGSQYAGVTGYIKVDGGKAPYALALKSGSYLPAGLSLTAVSSSEWNITGTCTGVQGQTYYPVFVATSADGQTRELAHILPVQAVAAPLVLTYEPFPAAVDTDPYGPIAPTITNGVGGTYTYTISHNGERLGGDPDGLTIDASTGEISAVAADGTPGVTYTGMVTVVEDDTGRTAQCPFAIPVSLAPATITLNMPSFTSAVAGASYSKSATVTGATGALSWVLSGTLPANMSGRVVGSTFEFYALAGGVGAASAGQTFTGSLQVTDAGTTDVDVQPWSISVPAIAQTPLTASIPALPNFDVGVAYGPIAFTISGGTAPYEIVRDGEVPAGITSTLTNAFQGTPTEGADETYPGQFGVNDSSVPPQVVTIPWSLVGNPAVSPAVTISMPTFTNAVPGAAYSKTITISGGTPGQTYGILVQALPAGLTISPDNLTPATSWTISGTVAASEAGITRSGTFRVFDAGTAETVIASWQIITDAATGPFVAPYQKHTLPSVIFDGAPLTGSTGIGYHTKNGRIFDNAGSEVVIKGVNIHGMQQGLAQNTSAAQSAQPRYFLPQGMWAFNWDDMLQDIKDRGFNAVRLTFSADTIHETRVFTYVDGSTGVNKWGPYTNTYNRAAFNGKTPMQIFDMLVDWCEANQVYVLLDFHQGCGLERSFNWVVPYNGTYSIFPAYDAALYTTAKWVADWQFMANRYKDYGYVLGGELINEPNSRVRWGRGDTLFDAAFDAQSPAEEDAYVYLKDGYEAASAAILAIAPKWLIFLQGSDSGYDFGHNSAYPYGWGEDYARLLDDPTFSLNIPINKTVLTPHAYGFGTQSYIGLYPTSTFWQVDGNGVYTARANWRTLDAAARDFHYGRASQTYAICPTEWGGTGIHYNQSQAAGKPSPATIGALDELWLDYYVDYRRRLGSCSGFLWTYYNSSDTTNLYETGIKADYIQTYADLMHAVAPFDTADYLDDGDATNLSVSIEPVTSNDPGVSLTMNGQTIAGEFTQTFNAAQGGGTGTTSKDYRLRLNYTNSQGAAVSTVTTPSTVTIRRVAAVGANALELAFSAIAANAGASFGVSASWAWGSDFLQSVIRWHWDPVNKRGYLIGKDPAAANHRLVRYDAGANTFTLLYDGVLTTGGGTGAGGGYDSSALDPATGDLYFLPYLAESVVKWNNPGWVVATGNVTGGSGANTTGPQAICWHPNLFGVGDGGLVHVRGGSVRAWRKSDGAGGTWSQVGTLPYSAINYACAAYDANLDAVVVSCGSAGLDCRVVYNSTTMGTADSLPLPASADATDANMNRLLQSPGGGVVLYASESPGRIWALNPTTRNWNLQAFQHTLRSDNPSWPALFASTYGGYLSLRRVTGGNPSARIYRPGALVYTYPAGTPAIDTATLNTATGVFTINGSNFGAKNPAAPYFFSDLNVTNGTQAVGSGRFDLDHRPDFPAPIITDAYGGIGGKSVFMDVQRDTDPANEGWFTHLQKTITPASQQAFCSSFFKVEWLGSQPSSGQYQFKGMRMGRLRSSSDSGQNYGSAGRFGTSLFIQQDGNWPGVTGTYAEVEEPSLSGGYDAANLPAPGIPTFGNGNWFNWEAFNKYNDIGSNNGLSHHTINGKLLANFGGLSSRTAANGYDIGFVMPHPGLDHTSARDWRILISRPYIDTTWSHVFLGNAATLAACTIRFPLPPTGWGPTTITATLSTIGNVIPSGLNLLWLYVCDSAGNINPAGKTFTQV